jgi:hypothetical protein
MTMKFPVFSTALLMLATGCASTMMPRVNDDLELNKAVLHGATVDATRGFPIAFYANPAQDPEYVELDHALGATRIAGAQWVTELARQMDNAIAKVSLFDQRFSPISQQVFAYDVSNGDLSFAWREPADGLPTAGIHIRIAHMRLDSFKTSATAEGVHVMASIEVKLGDYREVYTCERAGDRWERAVFACLGEKILGDAKLWKAAQSLP